MSGMSGTYTRPSDSLKLELRKVLNHPASGENGTQILCKSSECSYHRATSPALDDES